MLMNFWIYASAFFALACLEAELKTLSRKELQDIKRKWDECCETNICIRNSCYTVELRASGWAAVRQRCQGRYPDWPFAVDIFRIQDEEDIGILTKMLQESQQYSKDASSLPRTVWTSGTKCPKTGNKGSVMVNRWTSTNHPFPDWLQAKVEEASEELDEGCKFLVVYPAPSTSDIKYDFQEQTARHPAICEFVFPGEVDNNKWNETDFFSTDENFSSGTVTRGDNFKTSTTSKMIKSKTLNPAESSHWTSETPHHFTTVPNRVTSSSPPDEESHQTITTKLSRFCHGRFEAGIYWPDAAPGETVNKSCPEGMTGYAQWTCNEETLHYTPSRPHIQDCKHIWITNLEDDVKEGADAISISERLANETKHQVMSHGDITALVDLSTKILALYFSQTGDKDNEVKGKQEKPLSYNFTESMVASMSNMLRAEIKRAWEVLPEIHQTRAASQILKLVTSMGSHLSCTRKSDDSLQFTVAAENIGLQTFIFNNETSSEEDSLVFPQKVPNVETNSSIYVPADLDLKTWLSPCRSYKTAVGVIYNHVGDFLKNENQSRSTVHVVTKVISFSLTNSSESIKLPKDKKVTVVLQHLQIQDILKGILRYPRCMFWNFSKQDYGQWDGSGCTRVSSNLTHTVCTCDHLTNFAVLMDIYDNIQEDEIQSIMTYVCCGISSLTLVGTLVCFFTIRSLHGRRSIITGNLCLCLLITNLLILFGLDQTYNKIICATIAGLLHFWILSAFCWMLVEGYHLYRMVILVFQTGRNLSVKFYYLFAYGCPLIIVGISAALRSDGYGGPNYCWLSSHYGLMWSFVGPACVIILINIVIFILTLRSASTVRVKREQTTVKKIKSWARGSLSVMCLLGLTWCLGLFYINKTFHVVSYIFTLLNGLQGVFIFIFHIVLNEKIQSFCFTKWKGKNQYWNKNSKQTSNNRGHSKSSTRTSIESNGCANRNLASRKTRTLPTVMTSVPGSS
ncbi:adhesion G protein-coupled receptor L4-like isoform X2 [Argiope bruennichi]|uniref:adhesion G protein-coupled receptor L4-like isoform X2 n=1 Tax=Argiope bruennichi TaxID=94029 RepID=UPI002495A661|nr:adhesion G protein-coupled receptor L4-like isoform X2 [Argiope bruennichi]